MKIYISLFMLCLMSIFAMSQPDLPSDTLVIGGFPAQEYQVGAVDAAQVPSCYTSQCDELQCYAWWLPFDELNPDSTFSTTLYQLSSNPGIHKVQIWRAEGNAAKYMVLDTCFVLASSVAASGPPLKFTYPKRSMIAIYGAIGDTVKAFTKGLEMPWPALDVDIVRFDTLCQAVEIADPFPIVYDELYHELFPPYRAVKVPEKHTLYLYQGKKVSVW